MNKTKIPWCDYTWNPITGCSAVSEGCAHCYAETMSKRFNPNSWGHPVFHANRLDQPGHVKKPAKVFVCSMSDFFHPEVNLDWQLAIIHAMAMAPWHTYLFLTKRAKEMSEFFNNTPPSNWWIGITAENQSRYEERWTILQKTPAAIRFVSMEPLLGPIDMRLNGAGDINPDWVIVGPENGPGARPCNNEWIKNIRQECRWWGVPFFDKRDNWTRREFPYG